MERNLKNILIKSIKPILNASPILLGVILLMGLINIFFTKSFYQHIFSGNIISDSLIGSSLGSFFAGSPITSYILAGEFLHQDVSLIAVTSFLVAWVTVGIIQLPAEIMFLGKKFALWRNFISFFFSIFVALVTVFLVNIF